jgi:MFS family permease
MGNTTMTSITAAKSTHRLPWYDLIFINLFWLGLNVRNTAVGSLFVPYLVALYAPADWKNTALSAMSTAGLVIAMIVQPLAGLASDRSTSRYGRRRPFIIVGTMLDLVFLVAISLSGNYWTLLVAVLLIQFSANISHGPLQGVIPDLVPKDQRGRASSIKALFELLPIFVVGISIAKMLGAGHLGWAIATTGIFLLVTALLTIVTVKEKRLKEKPKDSFWQPMRRVFYMLGGILAGLAAGLLCGAILGGVTGLITWLVAGKDAAINMIVGVGGVLAMAFAVVIGVWAGASVAFGKNNAHTHSSFIWWIVNRLFFLAAITSLQRFAQYFFMYSFKIDIGQATILFGSLITVVGVGTLAAAFVGGWLADRFNKKLLVGWSGILAGVGCVGLLATILVPSASLIYVSGMILGVATGLFMTTNWAMGTNLVPAAEAGFYLGVSNLAGAGAGIIGGSIGGPVADYLNLSTPGLGYFVIFAGYTLLFILSTISLRYIREQKHPAVFNGGMGA